MHETAAIMCVHEISGQTLGLGKSLSGTVAGDCWLLYQVVGPLWPTFTPGQWWSSVLTNKYLNMVLRLFSGLPFCLPLPTQLHLCTRSILGLFGTRKETTTTHGRHTHLFVPQCPAVKKGKAWKLPQPVPFRRKFYL
jgi:hypothetical protein